MTDLESEAIVKAEVLEGDHADTKALSERVACAVEVVNRIVVNEQGWGRAFAHRRQRLLCH